MLDAGWIVPLSLILPWHEHNEFLEEGLLFLPCLFQIWTFEGNLSLSPSVWRGVQVYKYKRGFCAPYEAFVSPFAIRGRHKRIRIFECNRRMDDLLTTPPFLIYLTTHSASLRLPWFVLLLVSRIRWVLNQTASFEEEPTATLSSSGAARVASSGAARVEMVLNRSCSMHLAPRS